ncbi:hypothetical protein RRG08_001959 [Elysia crispata]|uniref:Uncharacterized protein n=1 Tax=Elysia crispata TaxID=231223 RepID=A0AAE1ECP4_9GAST|nr:hypothetical protein RRG08_001959 [Elysia crispata]
MLEGLNEDEVAQMSHLLQLEFSQKRSLYRRNQCHRRTAPTGEKGLGLPWLGTCIMDECCARDIAMTSDGSATRLIGPLALIQFVKLQSESKRFEGKLRLMLLDISEEKRPV